LGAGARRYAELLRVSKVKHNNAINADGLGQRAFGASPNPAGYGERSAAKTGRYE
jgi:hypothetical protein